jgi:hypothetical protein
MRSIPSISSQARSSSANPVRMSGRRVAAVRVHVLTEERDLADPVSGQRRHLGDYVSGPAGLLAAAHRRDDAVRTLRVAAHRDLDPGLERPLAPNRQISREVCPLGEPAARAVPPGPQPVGQVWDRAGSERDVDERVALEDPLALCLRVASANSDHPLGVVILERLRLGKVRGQSLIGLLTDRARVEHDHVRFVL